MSYIYVGKVKQIDAIENMEEKLTKVNNSVYHEKQRWHGDHEILNFHRESQGRIHSFKLFRENIKHGRSTL